MSFPERFVWGVATSAYQIEGACQADGRSPSVWDMFCKKPGAIWQGQTGDVACDHYHRCLEDVALMRQIGVGGYRFSISWPRVLPEGTGAVNPKGLGFYDRLVDALLEAGITPYVTLFHWDYPLALYRRGGWLNRDSAEWFAGYADAVVRALSDRVRHWMTQNEVQVFIVGGLQDGWHAPGDRLHRGEVLRAAHHALLAHGRAVQAIRAASSQPCQIGFAPVGIGKLPATDRAEDIAAARAALFGIEADTLWNNAWWLDPVLLGQYPDEGLDRYGADAPEPRPGDLSVISQPIDFLGVNIYDGRFVRAGPDGAPEPVPLPLGHPLTSFDWPVTPEAMYWVPRLFHERYRRPLLITENGISCRDWPALDGKVYDPGRIDFTARYLRELHRAITDGIPVLGYFHWSLLDNFEWSQGYKQRFGLVYVDYPTGQRVLKESAHWYHQVIVGNGAPALSGSPP